MLLTAVTLALSASLLPTVQQDDRSTRSGEPKQVPHESIPHDTWSGRRYAGGGVTITYRSYWVYIAEREYPFDATCVNNCQGSKHLAHVQCDTSCDKICKSLHEWEIKPKFEFRTDFNSSTKSWQVGMMKTIDDHGGNISQARHLANKVKAEAMKQIEGNDKYTYKYKSGHFNEAPCSTQDRDFKYTTYSLFADYTIYKDGTRVGGSGGVSFGPSALIGTVKIPHQEFYEQEPVESCRCQFIKEKQREIRIGGFMPLDGEGAFDGEGSDIRLGGLFIDPEGGEKYAQYNEQIGSNVSVSYYLGELNEFHIRATNMSAMPISLALMPGTTFEPDDGKFQSMVNLDQLQFTVPSWSTREWVMPASGPSQDPIDVKGFMACLNMNKNEPNGVASYTLGSTLDTTLLDIGYDMSAQRFRGPWNQALLWTYMDGASWQEINERLFPPVSESRYLNNLYELAHKYGVDLSAKKYDKSWNPRLILADFAPLEQLEWFVQEMTERDARSLANWVNGNRGKFAYIFAADGQDWYIEYAANVATALCGSDNEDVQAAGLDFLSRTVPQGKRAALMESGGLVGAVSLALGEGKNASAAMALVEEYDAELAEQLKTVPDELPFPKIDPPKRARASDPPTLAVWRVLRSSIYIRTRREAAPRTSRAATSRVVWWEVRRLGAAGY
ncbi:MAG: hypothetical protein IH944_12900 [Armatimonadetes bacterium]|nr:hypothetical protein [Armatimonadota bacterium]